jgi:FKBP-type peptidyl-prolyl cis-trans isomerase FkpA
MKRRAALAGIFLSLAWGCGPPDIIPATPPGVELPAPEIREEDQSIAQGEGGGQGEARPRTTNLVESKPNEPTEEGKYGFAESGLKYITLKPGTGEMAKTGDTVRIHYVGTYDGKEFQSSRKSGTPETFVLGSTAVLRGWNEGVAGMKAGEVRKLTLPPQLAFGAEGTNVIPPSATVEYEIELLRIGG